MSERPLSLNPLIDAADPAVVDVGRPALSVPPEARQHRLPSAGPGRVVHGEPRAVSSTRCRSSRTSSGPTGRRSPRTTWWRRRSLRALPAGKRPDVEHRAPRRHGRRGPVDHHVHARHAPRIVRVNAHPAPDSSARRAERSGDPRGCREPHRTPADVRPVRRSIDRARSPSTCSPTRTLRGVQVSPRTSCVCSSRSAMPPAAFAAGKRQRSARDDAGGADDAPARQGRPGGDDDDARFRRHDLQRACPRARGLGGPARHRQRHQPIVDRRRRPGSKRRRRPDGAVLGGAALGRPAGPRSGVAGGLGGGPHARRVGAWS